MSRDPRRSCPGVPCRPQDRWLAEVELGVADLAILAILRAFLQSFSDPTSQGWMAAFAVSRGNDGLGGADLALGVLDAVQALRVTRVSTFRFSNPACPGCAPILCEHERQFVQAFRALRTGRRSEAQAHAMLLCEGNDARRFVAALDRLVARASGVGVAYEAANDASGHVLGLS